MYTARRMDGKGVPLTDPPQKGCGSIRLTIRRCRSLGTCRDRPETTPSLRSTTDCLDCGMPAPPPSMTCALGRPPVRQRIRVPACVRPTAACAARPAQQPGPAGRGSAPGEVPREQARGSGPGPRRHHNMHSQSPGRRQRAARHHHRSPAPAQAPTSSSAHYCSRPPGPRSG